MKNKGIGFADDFKSSAKPTPQFLSFQS